MIGLIVWTSVSYKNPAQQERQGSSNNKITGSMTATSVDAATSSVTTILAIPTNLVYIRAENISVADVYCNLETLTAASSSVVVRKGLLLPGTSTSTAGFRGIEISVDALLNYGGGNLNCKGQGPATSTIILLYK